MSRGWKIFWWIIGILAGLILIVLGIVIAGYIWMQNIAKDVYGGKPPAGVISLIGFDLSPNKMAVYMDSKKGLAMVVIEQPLPAGSNAPFSEPDVKKALHSFDDTHQLESIFEGADNGTPTTFPMGSQTVHAVEYSSKEEHQSYAGVLNVDKTRLIFMATPPPRSNAKEVIADFLMDMPIVQKDSRLNP